MNNGVIIIGGGPVGIALGIELGMLGVNTIIIEKHPQPQKLPRAQLLNPRSMELFRRWGISEEIKRKRLLPLDFPIRLTWCSGLAGEVYGSVDAAEAEISDFSPESYQRIPLWITEDILRARLADFDCVQLIKNTEFVAVHQHEAYVEVDVRDRDTNQLLTLTANYAVGCDGARSMLREQVGIPMQTLLAPMRFISTMFISQELKEKATAPRSMLYYNLTTPRMMVLGYVDETNGLWYATIAAPGDEQLHEINVSALLDEAAGFAFEKTITQSNFWIRQAQIAENFRQGRVLIAGDAAHVMPPNGGHGLNTGLIGAVNLAWKLAAVVKHQAQDVLLDSYDAEMRPIALRNIEASIRNVQDATRVREMFSPAVMPKAFAKENARIAQQHTRSLGIALGYRYQQSQYIFDDASIPFIDDFALYHPIAAPGSFAPHCSDVNNQYLYDVLKNEFTLLVTEQNHAANVFLDEFNRRHRSIHLIELDKHKVKKLYPKKYYLLRPDWHIAWHADELPCNMSEFINTLLAITS